MAIEPSRRRITVTLPAALLDRLDARVPFRQRGAFIVRAVEERLAILEQAAAIAESAGAWQGDAYADMDTDQDVDRWLADLRGAPEDWPERSFHDGEDR